MIGEPDLSVGSPNDHEPITNDEAEALSDAAMAFANVGEDFKLPWNCDLDDEERGRFIGLLEACRAYHKAMVRP
jgi:hypothetical protein